jgi:hypothetical protein
VIPREGYKAVSNWIVHATLFVAFVGFAAIGGGCKRNVDLGNTRDVCRHESPFDEMKGKNMCSIPSLGFYGICNEDVEDNRKIYLVGYDHNVYVKGMNSCKVVSINIKEMEYFPRYACVFILCTKDIKWYAIAELLANIPIGKVYLATRVDGTDPKWIQFLPMFFPRILLGVYSPEDDDYVKISINSGLGVEILYKNDKRFIPNCEIEQLRKAYIEIAGKERAKKEVVVYPCEKTTVQEIANIFYTISHSGCRYLSIDYTNEVKKVMMFDKKVMKAFIEMMIGESGEDSGSIGRRRVKLWGKKLLDLCKIMRSSAAIREKKLNDTINLIEAK